MQRRKELQAWPARGSVDPAECPCRQREEWSTRFPLFHLELRGWIVLTGSETCWQLILALAVLEPALLECIPHEFGTTLKTEFLHRPGTICLDGLDTDFEPRCDLLVTMSRRGKPGDFYLPLTQHRADRLARVGATSHEPAHDFAGHSWVQIDFAGGHHTDGAD